MREVSYDAVAYADWVNRGQLWLPPRYRRPIAIDLFCGAGGFSLGFHQAGWHVIAAADNDPAAAITYLANLGDYPVQMHFVTEDDRRRFEAELNRICKAEGRMIRSGENRRNVLGDAPGCQHFWFGDLRKVSGQEILDALGMKPGEVDCVFGGPPCQGFSYAGRRNVMDPRNSLVFEFIRLVLEIRPKAMVMENVPGMLTMTTPEGVPVVDAICRILEDGGFGAYEALKRSLLATSGAGAVLRQTSERPGPDDTEPEDEGPQQLSLLAG